MDTSREVTIYDIAKKLNISAATVSRGLQAHPAISTQTKQKIHEAAQEMGYRFNSFASNLRKKRTNTIGAIVPRLNSSFMSDVISGIEKVANETGYNLIISQSLESVRKETENALTMFNSRVDGLLVSLAYNTEDISHFESFINKGIPLLFFDRIAQHPQCPNITIDNNKAGYEVTQHLIDQGCRNIVHITGNLRRNVYHDRFEGFRKALQANNLNFNPEQQLMISDLSYAAGTAAAKKILSDINKPDALFVANDTCAVACMLELKKHGINIPQDIALVGFNNDPLCEVAEPHLSTIRYPGELMGELAAKELIATLHQPEAKETRIMQHILKHELIIRSSSLKNTPA